jgi:protein SCO1
MVKAKDLSHISGMNRPPFSSPLFRRLFPAMLLALIGGGYLYLTGQPGASDRIGPSGESNAVAEPIAGGSSCLTRTYAEIGGPIDLIGEGGLPVTEQDLMGRQSLVFFGFTYCPDICPMALYTLGEAIKRLPEGVPAPRTVLITVDPDRDTPEILSRYLSDPSFPDDAIGLTGDARSIRAAADAFKADYRRVDDASSAAGYTMDHTSIIYLMDENWKLKSFFTHADSPEQIATCLTSLAQAQQ